MAKKAQGVTMRADTTRVEGGGGAPMILEDHGITDEAGNAPDLPGKKAPGIYMGGESVQPQSQPQGGGLRATGDAAGGGGAGGLEYGTGIYQGGEERAPAPAKPSGIYMGGERVGGSAAPSAPNPAPTTSTPPPVTTSPTTADGAKPNPAVSSSPAQGPAPKPQTTPLTAGTRMAPTPQRRPMQQPPSMLNRYPGPNKFSHELGAQMAKQAAVKKVNAVFTKIAKALARRVGVDPSRFDNMEKSAIAFLPLLAGLIPGLGLAHAGYKYGKREGWWESPAIKAMKDRMRAIQMAKAQGVDPARMGLIAPKPEKRDWEKSPYKDYSSWGGWGGGDSAMPKGYMKTERDLQNMAKNLRLAGRHSQAFSQLARMPVF